MGRITAAWMGDAVARRTRTSGEDEPDEVDVTTCSLDHQEHVPPTDHIQTSSKLRWVHLSDGLPRHPEARPVG